MRWCKWTIFYKEIGWCGCKWFNCIICYWMPCWIPATTVLLVIPLVSPVVKLWYWDIANETIQTELGRGNGSFSFDEVSRFDTIICSVMTSGFHGQTLVFLNAALIVFGVSAFQWALPYTEMKFSFVTFCHLELSNVLHSWVQQCLSGPKMTTSSHW